MQLEISKLPVVMIYGPFHGDDRCRQSEDLLKWFAPLATVGLA
jgi:hypothetical protein